MPVLPHDTPVARRAGAMILLGGALVVAVATLLRGAFVDPRTDPAGFAAWVASARYRTACLLFVAGLFAHGIGMLALYGHLAPGRAGRLALVGALGVVLSDGFVLIMMGAFGFVFPEVGRLYAAGDVEVMRIATGFGTPFMVLQAFAAVTLVTATIATTVALWRAGDVPRWAAIGFLLGGIVVAFAPPLPYAAELPGTIVYAIGYAGIARTMARPRG